MRQVVAGTPGLLGPHPRAMRAAPPGGVAGPAQAAGRAPTCMQA